MKEKIKKVLTTILVFVIIITFTKASSFANKFWNVFFNHRSQTVNPILLGDKIYLSLQDISQIFSGLKISIDRKNNIIGLKYDKFNNTNNTKCPKTIEQIHRISILPILNKVEKKTQKSVVYPDGNTLLTKLFKAKLFNSNKFIVIPNNITTYTYSRQEAQSIAKKLNVDAVIIGKLETYEYRTDTSGKWASPLVEAEGQIMLVEANTGRVLWLSNLHKFNTNFSAFNSGSKKRRLRLLKDILDSFATDSVYNLIGLKDANK